MQAYVLGFLFDNYDSVALIKKNRPEWQAGKVNAIGGKVEPGETEYDAMVREFEEETGVHHVYWECFGLLESPRSKIWLFRGKTTRAKLLSVRTVEDEEVFVHNTFAEAVPKNALPNLHWLLPLAMNTEEKFVKATYP